MSNSSQFSSGRKLLNLNSGIKMSLESTVQLACNFSVGIVRHNIVIAQIVGALIGCFLAVVLLMTIDKNLRIYIFRRTVTALSCPRQFRASELHTATKVVRCSFPKNYARAVASQLQSNVRRTDCRLAIRKNWLILHMFYVLQNCPCPKH